MKLEKNWFYSFCIALSVVGIAYILITGVSEMQGNQEYPYAMKGMLILIFFLAWVGVHFLALLSARLGIKEKLSKKSKLIFGLETVYVLLILIFAFIMRVAVIIELPMKPASDYKTYYEIAVMMKKGILQEKGEGYCNYIAMFPHIAGYCYILKNIFVLFGTSVWNGQMANVFFSLGTVFFVYRIARKLGGKIAGIVALTGSAFWPSQILYINMLAAEYSFSFFLFLSVLLFLHLVMDYDSTTKNGISGILLHILLGCLIAITAAIRPMALILLIAILLFLIPQKMSLPGIPINSISIWVRFLAKGWLRGLLILASYMVVSGIITTDIELLINKSVPSFSQSFGYNLLVGLNNDASGGWNEEDSKFLYDNLERTGSPIEAQTACRDEAFQRLVSNPNMLFNLFIKKYELLWGNDNYGSDWNLAFLKEQNELTQTRADFLYKVKSENQIVYLVFILFSFLTLIYLLKKQANGVYVLILIYLGTAAMHLMVESQNRYHFHAIPVLIILGSVGVAFIFDNAIIFVESSDVERQRKEKQMIRQEAVLKKFEMEEHKAIEERYKNMTNSFDMKSAITNGNVTVTVSEIYAKSNNEENSNDIVYVAPAMPAPATPEPAPAATGNKAIEPPDVEQNVGIIDQEEQKSNNLDKVADKKESENKMADESLLSLILELEEIAETGKIVKKPKDKIQHKNSDGGLEEILDKIREIEKRQDNMLEGFTIIKHDIEHVKRIAADLDQREKEDNV
ncbi:hypothetical protein RZO55_19450 [Clostridium boliviensis]|uniref:Glycosyltransferase RgtA/B/C/D-like domain-containing protein n=1 Tax=Clostridium boliviensis TaxID=318465 RepID=A0ABU4GQ61_9CLOT|nr:hypothetical protein [Clostridium boliviensis]